MQRDQWDQRNRPRQREREPQSERWQSGNQESRAYIEEPGNRKHQSRGQQTASFPPAQRHQCERQQEKYRTEEPLQLLSLHRQFPWSLRRTTQVVVLQISAIFLLEGNM